MRLCGKRRVIDVRTKKPKQMGSGKERNPNPPAKMSKPLGPKPTKLKKKKKKKHHPNNTQNQIETQNTEPASPSAQLNSFLHKFQSANRLQLSSLELDSLTDKCIVDLSGSTDQDVESLGKHVKAAFGPSWKQELCDNRLVEGKVDPGSPAVLIISTSALRSIQILRWSYVSVELVFTRIGISCNCDVANRSDLYQTEIYRGFRSLTKECHAVKLFSKHMKVDEQITLLKDRVNIASGTPNRIKKLIDIEALGLSRLSVIVLDVHPDVKGYSLLTLPQVRDEFWDSYKTYFHQRLLQGSLRLSLYGPLISDNEFKEKKRPDE